jgi:DNA-binding transcriptional MerR regulator
LTISQLERASGIPRSTIHYYVREGLLPQPQKTGGTRALYSQDHVRLLQRIQQAKASGRSLSEIRVEVQAQVDQFSENSVDLLAQEYDRAHQAMLRFATREFVRKGYRRTHVADLIRELGISSSVFYAHFPSKHHLLVECFATFISWATSAVESRAAVIDDFLDRQVLRTAAGMAIHGLSSDMLALVTEERLQSEPGLREPVEEAWGKVIRHLSTELAAMRPAGSPPPAVPDEVLAYSLNGALQTALTRALWDPGFTFLDVVRTQAWLWMAIRAAMSGEVDINTEFASHEDFIREVVARPPSVLPADEP